jgi:hypothetical protein
MSGDLSLDDAEILETEAKERLKELEDRQWEMVLDLSKIRREIRKVLKDIEFYDWVRTGDNWKRPLTDSALASTLERELEFRHVMDRALDQPEPTTPRRE